MCRTVYNRCHNALCKHSLLLAVGAIQSIVVAKPNGSDGEFEGPVTWMLCCFNVLTVLPPPTAMLLFTFR